MDKNFSIKNYAEALNHGEYLDPVYSDGNGTLYQSLTRMMNQKGVSYSAVAARLKSAKCKTTAEAVADAMNFAAPHRTWKEIVCDKIYRNFAKPAQDFAINRKLLREHIQKGHLDMNTAVFIQYVQGCKLVGPNGETMTIPELAEKFHKSEEDVISLLDKTAPANASDVADRTWYGIVFPSVKAMVKIVGRGKVAYSTYVYNRSNGMTVEQAMANSIRRRDK